MKAWIRRTWLGCAVALALGAPVAHASGGGTITFVGAIVAPTCSFDGGEQATPQAMNNGCGCGTAPVDQSTHTSIYRQEVVPLEDALSTQDRLLSYFAGYAGTTDTRLTTRTYE
jgi:hypothetical protein